MPVYEGIAQFCYTRDLPKDAVAIASLSSDLTKPSDLVDVFNTTYLPAPLDVRLDTTADSDPADFTCPDYFQPVTISGSTHYKVDNQFFQLSDQLDGAGNIMWCVHALPTDILGNAVVIDLFNNIVTSKYIIVGNNLYHSLTDQPYLIEYTDNQGYVHTNLLQTTPILAKNLYIANSSLYILGGRVLQVETTGNYYIQFVQPDGYMGLVPWVDQPNSPWYMRIRFPLSPYPTEYVRQVFTPVMPFILASYVPGTVYTKNIVKFERPNIFYDPAQLPNILVLNSDFSVKYAIDGSKPGTIKTLGTNYNWQRGLIFDIDPYSATVQLSVDIDPTDIIYGFYAYSEPDYIFRAIDVNPFTNPSVKNRYVQFYAKTSNPDPTTNIFYQVVDPVTGPVSGLTNDNNLGVGTSHIFATVSVGADVSTSAFTITDIRVRGGGLNTANQTDPSATSCWDLGFWDGKPYPVEGAIMVYVPQSLLNNFTEQVVQASIQAVLPAGVYPLIRYYLPDGTEVV